MPLQHFEMHSPYMTSQKLYFWIWVIWAFTLLVYSQGNDVLEDLPLVPLEDHGIIVGLLPAPNSKTTTKQAENIA